MRAQRALLGVVLAAIASGGFATTLASSSFDDGRRGWIAGNGSQNFHGFEAGGAPDGFIQASDSSAQTLWFFSAPAACLGDKLAPALNCSQRRPCGWVQWHPAC